ncbi:MAG: hypothetical protein KJO56_10230 [Gammaproteobacteria bacterium]|nr:hypothetical protein [Gammaproteobacteria bacterium]MBT8104792.1 hypothetical protein [Gammaproteobacteria bacterium]NNF50088.1 hypothetical protein [Woeseiaceae bacterium]NNK24806.1 hypothetical protein [Woeseiaceae bacterium]
MKRIFRATLIFLLAGTTTVFAAPKPDDVIVINSPDVNVANVPDVVVANSETDPLPVKSAVRRLPVLCTMPAFSEAGSQDAACFSPEGAASPVPVGFYLAITDIFATSQLPAGSNGQSVVRVTSRIGGTTFGAGVPMILKPGETQSMHFQTPYQVLPAGRIPRASVGLNFGAVFPVEVKFTGYLIAVDDLGY